MCVYVYQVRPHTILSTLWRLLGQECMGVYTYIKYAHTLYYPHCGGYWDRNVWVCIRISSTPTHYIIHTMEAIGTGMYGCVYVYQVRPHTILSTLWRLLGQECMGVYTYIKYAHTLYYPHYGGYWDRNVWVCIRISSTPTHYIIHTMEAIGTGMYGCVYVYQVRPHTILSTLWRLLGQECMGVYTYIKYAHTLYYPHYGGYWDRNVWVCIHISSTPTHYIIHTVEAIGTGMYGCVYIYQVRPHTTSYIRTVEPIV